MKHKKVTWLELFFDLVFVTAVSSTTHLLLSVDCHPDKTAIYFVEYLLMVIPMFWCWVGQTMFVNRFGGEKKNLELYMIPQMFFAILLTASFHSAFSDAYHTFLIGYLGIRFIIIIQYFTMSRSLVNAPRKVALLLGNIFLLGSLTTGVSFFFDGTLRYFFVYLGIVVDMVIPPFYINTLRKVPVDFYHLAERFGLFVIITFGESFFAITSILFGHTLDPYTVMFAFFGFIIIWTFWASYFRCHDKLIDFDKPTHGQCFIYGHFLIIISIMLLAANLHLLFDNILQREILLLMLFGAVGTFFISKQLVFAAHKKAGVTFYLWKNASLLLLLIGLFFINILVELPLFISFFCIWICAVLDLSLQNHTFRLANI
ncbi:low temperature requirement protein A [Listeria ivanovii]|uniref:low temperature requirement protein A n=1 Tax=Listeria ivanovii TaxID=1638 RepID=UPI000DA93DE8|nr:low temperature requirement protein A [Listeria ivanovii]PZG33378.1 low temperature requirement protein A [Listeria ivanovii]PZG47115.1 low temperature requirement protein A [Listeria ivanovii]PZH11029.1 low temperature requirement protein A [Listeria ivanovii]